MCTIGTNQPINLKPGGPVRQIGGNRFLGSVKGLHIGAQVTCIDWRNLFLSSFNVYKFGLKLVFLSLDGRAAGVEVTKDESRGEPKLFISNGTQLLFSRNGGLSCSRKLNSHTYDLSLRN
jgi:hypothetical protein